jgi:predicted alpha/beta hydrolase family esterase
MEKSLVIIHGGTTFDTYEEYWNYLVNSTLTLDKITRIDWKDTLKNYFPEIETIYLRMPNSKNARYPEWKLWFEKLIPLLNDEIILVGHSLGGIFLAKYLSENKISKRVIQLNLVAPPYDTEVIKDSLADFALEEKVSNITEQVDSVIIYQSKDDQAVAYEDALKYKEDMPEAELIVFEDRGHFLQEEFPELVENIKKALN